MQINVYVQKLYFRLKGQISLGGKAEPSSKPYPSQLDGARELDSLELEIIRL